MIKYAIQYDEHYNIEKNAHKDNVGEIRYVMTDNESDNCKLLDTFLENSDDYKNKGIKLNLDFDLVGDDYFTKDVKLRLQLLKAKEIDFVVTIYSYEFAEKEILRKLNIPYMFSESVISFQALYYALKEGVSQVIIDDELGFNLPVVKKLCDKKGVKVRWRYSSSKSYLFSQEESKYRFFIPPDKLDIYQDYIDYIEFTGKNRIGMMHTYNSGVWYGDYKILFDATAPDDEFANCPSDFLLPEMWKRRTTCDRKCIKGRNCNICERAVELAMVMKDELTGRGLTEKSVEK